MLTDLAPFDMYTVVKVDGSAPNRWLSKGP